MPWLVASTVNIFAKGWSAVAGIFTSRPPVVANSDGMYLNAESVSPNIHVGPPDQDFTPIMETQSTIGATCAPTIMPTEIQAPLFDISSKDPQAIIDHCLHILSLLSFEEKLEFSSRLNFTNKSQPEGHVRSLFISACMMMRYCGSSSCDKYDTFIKSPMTKLATMMGYSYTELDDFVLFLGSDALRVELKRCFKLLDIKHSIVGTYRYIPNFKSVVTTLSSTAGLPAGTALDVLTKEHIDPEGMYIGPVADNLFSVSCHNQVKHQLHVCVGIVYDQACLPQFKAMVNEESIANYMYYGDGFLRYEVVEFEGRRVTASVILVDSTTDAANWGKSSQDQKPQYFTTISARIINYQKDCINCAEGVALLGMHNCNDKNSTARNRIIEVAHFNLKRRY